MPIIEKNKKHWRQEGDNIILSPEFVKIGMGTSPFTKFAKITGSRFNVILGMSHYKSPFQAWTTMVKIFKEPFIPEALNIAGNKIEIIMKDWYSKKFHNGKQFVTQDPNSCGWDVFKDDNKIFGGIPDGEPAEGYGSGLPMLEMKTSSIDKLEYKMDKETGGLKLTMIDGIPKVKLVGGKKAEWIKDNTIIIPLEYKLQLALYMYLRGVNNGVFLVSFLKPEDYKNPESYNPDLGDTHVVEFKVTDMDEFKKNYIDVAEQWYNNHIVSGKSPAMTSEDKKWWQEQLNRKQI